MTGTVSIPSQAGILLAGLDAKTGEPALIESQYPLRRASSWRAWAQYRGEAREVSIPSQAGILLAVSRSL